MNQDEIKTLIERKHPEYVDRLAHWVFLDSCYRAGREWFSANIFRYLKEGDTEYSDRVARAYRFNHTREVVDLVNKYLFKAEISRSDSASEDVQAFWHRATKSGLSIDEQMRIASTKTSIFGRVFMVIDSTAEAMETEAGQPARSVQDDEDDGDTVYSYLASPIDVMDLAYDDDGDLLWVLLREYKRDDQNPWEATGDVHERFKLWTKKDWFLIELDLNEKDEKKRQYKITDEGNHDLGLVPVVPIDVQVSNDPYFVPALINDIAYLDRATANYASNLDAIIQDQTFSQLAMPAQNLLPGETAYDQMLDMGTKRIFIYDGEGGKEPKFISPDPSQASLILSAIGQLINEIYHSVGLAGERTKQDNSKGIDNSSGVAKSKDFERVSALLSARADAMELAENRIVKIVSAYAGEEIDPSDKDLVSYGREFDVRALGDDMDVAMKLSILDMPADVLTEHSKAIIDKLFPFLSEERQKELVDAIAERNKESQENATLMAEASKEGSTQIEELKRDREGAGDKQSNQKSRDTDS